MSDISINGLNSYVNTLNENAISNAGATNAKKSIGGISSNSTEEELTEAVKSFEVYFMEQIMKNVKESIESINDDEEDSAMSNYVDYFSDSTLTQMATSLVEQAGGSLTESLVEQLKRNYNIESSTESSVEKSVESSAESDL